jgi:hypothetical protein
MDEENLKLLDDADEEIERITGRKMEYLMWLGSSATVLTSTAAAIEKLVNLAKEQRRPFTEEEKREFLLLQMFGDAVTLTASALEEIGTAIDTAINASTGEALPPARFNLLVRKYVAAHRLGYNLWLGREEHRLLSRPSRGRPN